MESSHAIGAARGLVCVVLAGSLLAVPLSPAFAQTEAPSPATSPTPADPGADSAEDLAEDPAGQLPTQTPVPSEQPQVRPTEVPTDVVEQQDEFQRPDPADCQVDKSAGGAA